MSVTLEEIARNPSIAETLPAEDRRALWLSAKLASSTLEWSILADLYAALGLIQSREPREAEHLMTVKETAKRLGVSACTVYRNADDYAFCVRQPNGRPMFSLHGLKRWLEDEKRRK